MLGINPDGTTHFHVLNIKDLHKLWEISYKQTVVCEYNPASQPARRNASKIRLMTKKFVRIINYVRIRDEWTDIPQRTKEDI
jgi:hypothetical protein